MDEAMKSPPDDPYPHDLPKDELIRVAEATLVRMQGQAQVLFKFTCATCGERCTFQKPNTIYEQGECCVCGAETPFTRGGFMLVLVRPMPDAER